MTASDGPDLSAWLADADVCARLGISVATLDREVKRGHLHPLHRPRAGNRAQRVFDPQEVQSRVPSPPVRALTTVPSQVPAVASPLTALREPDTRMVRPEDADQVIARLLEMAVDARRPPKPWATLDEAAEDLGLSRRFLRRLVDSGALEAVRDRAIKVRREDLQDLDVDAVLLKPPKARTKRGKR